MSDASACSYSCLIAHASCLSSHRAMRGVPACSLSFFVPNPVLVIIGGRRVQLPPMLVSVAFLLSGLQFLVVLIGHAHGLAHLFDVVLSRRRRVAGHRLVALRL